MSEDSTTVRQWTDILRRVRFGKRVAVGTATVSGATVKAVALALATYADSDGTRVFPGLARLSVDLEVDYRTAKRALAVLRTLGLLQLVRAGARRGLADEYRLALPVDLMEHLQVLSPSQHELEVEKVRAAHRRTTHPGTGHTGTRTNTPVQGIQCPVPTPSATPVRGTQAPVPGLIDTVGTGHSVLADEVGTGHSVFQYGALDALPPTTTDVTTTTDHDEIAVRTAVTATRDPAAVEDPISEVGASRAETGQCDHGLTTARRADGRLACVACRVAEDRAAGRRPEPVAHRANDRARVAAGDAVVLSFQPVPGLRRRARAAS